MGVVFLFTGFSSSEELELELESDSTGFCSRTTVGRLFVRAGPVGKRLRRASSSLLGSLSLSGVICGVDRTVVRSLEEGRSSSESESESRADFFALLAEENLDLALPVQSK